MPLCIDGNLIPPLAASAFPPRPSDYPPLLAVLRPPCSAHRHSSSGALALALLRSEQLHHRAYVFCALADTHALALESVPATKGHGLRGLGMRHVATWSLPSPAITTQRLSGTAIAAWCLSRPTITTWRLRGSAVASSARWRYTARWPATGGRMHGLRCHLRVGPAAGTRVLAELTSRGGDCWMLAMCHSRYKAGEHTLW